MHDPMVVAHEIPSPFPHRDRWKERGDKRWGFDVMRRTNPENLGERCYPWWRLKGRTLRLAGRAYGLGRLATIWHVEPGGRDAFEVCKQRRQRRNGEWYYSRRWPGCSIGAPNVAGRAVPITATSGTARSSGLYHRECSALVSMRRTAASDEALIRHLFAAMRVQLDITEGDLLARLTDPRARGLEFHESYRLTHLLGYKRDADYRLVKK